MSEQIVKVTSKGQLTIPSSIRREAGMDRGSYIYMKPIGGLGVMKKVHDLSVDEISSVLEEVAGKKGITRSLLLGEAERARGRLWKERYGKAPRDA
ncbi:MAG: AbrB/MazE/SpoVT family DNA-binding domain-containing protein [Nitrososphaerota archaeon]|nr:AbrB/MazE/SpoVT family DNA-binding domain-containing protein [Nitrososphaerota archaeon]